MYYYVFDAFTNDKKFLSQVQQIENRVMQLGISGHIEKLTMLKSLEEMVAAAIKRGAKNIIAVGNDETISKMMRFLPQHAVTFGMIPLGEPNTIAGKLGIPHGVAACDTLSARITTKIDLGKVNSTYFISSLALPSDESMVIDFGPYHMSATAANSDVHIYNMNGAHHSDPTDGVLEAVVHEQTQKTGFFSRKPAPSHSSIFPIQKVTIRADKRSGPVIADGHIRIPTPVTVEVAPKKLTVIVGKDRHF